MKLRVLIESPFGRNPDGSKCTPAEYERNTVYVRRALAHSLRRGEAPFASHALYPLVLDDAKAGERRMGMEAGFAWGEAVHLVAVYADYGITPGMREGIGMWESRGLQITYLKIGPNP